MNEFRQPIPDEEKAVAGDSPVLPETEAHAERPLQEEVSIPQLIEGVATQLIEYSLQIKPGDELLIKLDPSGYELSQAVLSQIEKINESIDDPAQRIRVRIQFVMADLDKLVQEGVSGGEYTLPHSALVSESVRSQLVGDSSSVDMPLKGAAFIQHGPASDEARFLSTATKVLVIRNNYDYKNTYAIDREIARAFSAANKPLIDYRVNELDWCLIYVPNEQEAAAAGMTLEEYTRLTLEACNRPWAEVEKAQQVLIDRLRTAKTARITAPAPAGRDLSIWTTDIRMNIEGMIAANSVARRNMPGSEVFLAPNAGTLEGQYALPYPVTLGGKVLPDLALTFAGGKVLKFVTSGDAELQAHIQKVLDTDSGSAFVGEWGIGTNPSVDVPVLNRLLNEKILGIHLALGDAYTATQYLGAEIKVDNGVRSAIHEDLARVMTEKAGGGQIILDDTDVIFDNGRFTLHGTEVLNGK